MGMDIYTVFIERRALSIAFLAFLLLSIICQVTIGVIYRKLIKETDNMSAAKNKFLKQCKLKFINCYQISGEVSNISVFVDKSISKITFLKISMTALHHLAGQFILLSVATAGAGACYEITQGETVGKILPYYLVSFLGLYVYFSISGLVDISGKRERLKINLIDYLENHLANQLKQSDVDWEELTGETISKAKTKIHKKKKKGAADGINEKDKKRLLREEIGLSAERGDAAKVTAFTQSLEQGEQELEEEKNGKEKIAVFSHQEAQELEELLREFLV